MQQNDCVMPPVPGKPEFEAEQAVAPVSDGRGETDGTQRAPLQDADQINKLLELELEQKRAEWKRSRERHRTVRILSFAFLFLVIAGALVAFFFIFTRLQH